MIVFYWSSHEIWAEERREQEHRQQTGGWARPDDRPTPGPGIDLSVLFNTRPLLILILMLLNLATLQANIFLIYTMGQTTVPGPLHGPQVIFMNGLSTNQNIQLIHSLLIRIEWTTGNGILMSSSHWPVYDKLDPG